jgi:hypothetical protein
MASDYLKEINNNMSFEQAEITKSYLNRMLNYYSNLDDNFNILNQNKVLEEHKLKEAEKQLKKLFPELYLL